MMRRGGVPARALIVVLLALPFVACRGCTSSRPPIHVNPSMDNQPKYRPQSESAFFYDGAAMRPPVPGTVARGELYEDRALYEGKDDAGLPVATSPIATTPELLARGADRYHVYCEPCHDARGDGKGILFAKGNIPTASFHTDILLQRPDGHIFDVITNGFGLMQGYKWPIAAEDRWAIIAHVRELQRKRREQKAAAVAEGTPTPAPEAASPAPAEATPAAQPSPANQ